MLSIATIIGFLAVGSLATPIFPFGDHSRIQYCNDHFPSNCHYQRVHEKECTKLDHPGNVRWIGAWDSCWLYSNDKCTGNAKSNLDVFPMVFDSPFDGKAVYCD
ncbi:hypothetical protein PENSTE_c005G02221 [Penicillium steckii]|uniref:Uncharacterized protein n=1 Tax=Penicillium steckii TaxID=303698 RepID=A0A1V6TJ24_9EURO|nr:hypothetical protein PENSTE_c005G02221 [Penicillium steckii]